MNAQTIPVSLSEYSGTCLDGNHAGDILCIYIYRCLLGRLPEEGKN